MLSGEKNNIEDSTNPWTEDPIETYKKFLKSAGEEVDAGVEYNRSMLTLFAPLSSPTSNPKKEELKVYAKNCSFYPLETAVGMPLYCSKITIRNVEKAAFGFHFGENILPDILGIETKGKTAESLLIAYRNIVPSEFEQCPQMAGPMGFHEYIIDGNHFDKTASITFVANSDFKKTPIKIVFENCNGMGVVKGLKDDSIDQIFENKCDKKEFCLFPMLENKISDSANEEQQESPRMRR